MAAKGATYANDLLKHIFQNSDLTLIGDAAGLQNSAAAGSLYLSLHTASPAGGTQATNECSYVGYARIAVARSAGGFTISGTSCTLAATAEFAESAIGDLGTVVTHFGLGTTDTGAGKLMYYGAVTPNIALGDQVIPRLGTGTTITET